MKIGFGMGYLDECEVSKVYEKIPVITLECVHIVNGESVTETMTPSEFEVDMERIGATYTCQKCGKEIWVSVVDSVYTREETEK